MKKFITCLILFFAISLQNPLLYSQRDIKQETKISSLDEKSLKENLFDFSGKKNIRDDISYFGKLPDEKMRVQFDKNSYVYAKRIMPNLERLIDKSILPDLKFIKENARFYTVTEHAEVETLDWSLPEEYDIIYISYSVDDRQILFAMTGAQLYGATYLYVKKKPNEKFPQDTMNVAKQLLTNDAFKLAHIIKESDQLKERAEMLEEPSIPIFVGKSCFCLTRSNCFTTEGMTAAGFYFNDWFLMIKQGDKKDEELQRRAKAIKSILNEQTEKCKTLIKTPQGRAELIAMLNSEKGKIEYADDTYHYKYFRNLPYDALNKFYNELHCETRDKLNSAPIRILEISTPIENDAIRKLLQSTDFEVKQYGIKLIYITEAKSLLPDLVKHTTDKEQVFATSSPSALYIDLREYHSKLYGLLGKIGNQRTIKFLEQLRQSDKISDKSKEFAEFAIEMIKKNLDKEKRSKQSWLDWRRELREKKIITDIIDFDKPDPEPISPDGFRKWETSDGLFKTTAKFVGLKEIKDKTGKIIDKDIQLLRNDNKTVA
ncbi:MAG: hypothetical protein LBB88_02540, partial [Planctomycetaceae bacterium]|nr:hypothetical protein [Planctomycetaceae bacterium]